MTISYEEQAINFLKNSNATIKIKFIGKDTPKNWGSGYHNHYKFTIKTKLGQYTGDFWDSIHNTENGINPTEYDILSCLEVYPSETFEEFCDEFGYNEEDKSAKQIYNAIIKQWKSIQKIFTEEQIEELANIW